MKSALAGLQISNIAKGTTSLELHLDGAWSVFWLIFQFPGGLWGWYGSLPSWPILTQKLDALSPGMGPGEGLNGLKPPSYMYKQVTGAFRV